MPSLINNTTPPPRLCSSLSYLKHQDSGTLRCQLRSSQPSLHNGHNFIFPYPDPTSKFISFTLVISCMEMSTLQLVGLTVSVTSLFLPFTVVAGLISTYETQCSSERNSLAMIFSFLVQQFPPFHDLQ